MRPTSRPARVASAVAAVALVTGCSSGASPAGAPPATAEELVHVHGLGTAPDGSAAYAATHSGLWRLPLVPETWEVTGSLERVGTSLQDTMGFTIAPSGTFYGSGHPDLAERPDLVPPHLGLVRSEDAGESWTDVALQGEVDFHDLEVVERASGPDVVGYDATRGRVMSSGDGGRTWRVGATVEARDLALPSPDASVVLATTAAGVRRSADGGATFGEPEEGWPSLLLLEATGDGGLVGVDPSGGVHAADESGRWEERGRLAGPPEALAAVHGSAGRRLLAVDSRGLVASDDGGASWSLLAPAGG